MTGYAVAPDQLDHSASVFHTEAEVALNVLTTFKAQIQILQDTFHGVPPDVWDKLTTDLRIYTTEYHDALAGIGSGLRKNYVNYTDIEAANSKLVSIDGYTPVKDFYMGVRPAIRITEQAALVSRLRISQTATPVPKAALAATSGAGSGAPPQVDAWISQAMGVLESSGVPASQLSPSDLWIIIQHESGGDPSAVNNWDHNAAVGTPSIGIMQTIGPTFNAYALPGHTDITNPVDNIVAGTRYALARYGSLDNVPGVLAVHNGQPYVAY